MSGNGDGPPPPDIMIGLSQVGGLTYTGTFTGGTPGVIRITKQRRWRLEGTVTRGGESSPFKGVFTKEQDVAALKLFGEWVYRGHLSPTGVNIRCGEDSFVGFPAGGEG